MSEALRREKRTRRSVALTLATCAGAIMWLATHEVGPALTFTAFLVVALELSWVLFAFEATPEYHALRSADANGIVGMHCVVMESCAPKGTVKLRGELWQARSEDATAIAAGERAVVTRLETGLLLVVQRL